MESYIVAVFFFSGLKIITRWKKFPFNSFDEKIRKGGFFLEEKKFPTEKLVQKI